MKFYNNQPRVEKVIATFQNILIFWRVLVVHWQGHHFVVFVDSFSKWVDIQYLKDLSAASLTNTLRRIFKYVGLPTTLVSDNSTNFTSKVFLKYLLDNCIHHVFMPPGHHASNGQVEHII